MIAGVNITTDWEGSGQPPEQMRLQPHVRVQSFPLGELPENRAPFSAASLGVVFRDSVSCTSNQRMDTMLQSVRWANTSLLHAVGREPQHSCAGPGESDLCHRQPIRQSSDERTLRHVEVTRRTLSAHGVCVMTPDPGECSAYGLPSVIFTPNRKAVPVRDIACCACRESLRVRHGKAGG